ncbi:MAG: hypothetical protein HYV93_11005 [Candidatus Rokubacteria bacterium]|nr:hypothetical protein [Candidatus Rokubacteria bacterium]
MTERETLAGRDAAGSRALDAVLFLAPLAVLALFFRDLWWAAQAFSVESADNLDLVYPLFDRFFAELKQGRLAVWNPFLWGGMPLVGNPNFALSPLHLLAGWWLDRGGFIWFMSVFSFLELLAAFHGFHLLARALWPGRPVVALWAATLYLFSGGVFTAYVFFSTSFHFAAIPWTLLLLARISRPSWVRTVGWLALLLWFQLTWGQLQFTLYSIYLYLGFALFAAGRGRRLLGLGALCAGGAVAGLLSAAHLMPLLESLRIAAVDEPRLSVAFHPAHQRVPVFYALRLLYPSLVGGVFPEPLALRETPGIPWWPVWRDGWSLWESFTAYQGIVVTVTAAFGTLFGPSRLFWKVPYVAIALATTTTAGVGLLYYVHLGMSVPYGRLTVLLSLFATVLCVDTVLALPRSRRLCWGYIVFLAAVLACSAAWSASPLLARVVERGFAEAYQRPEPFIAQYLPALRQNVTNHNVFLAAALAAVAAYLLATRRPLPPGGLRARWIPRSLVLTLALLASSDGIAFLERGREQSLTTLQTLGIFRPHPLERALQADAPDWISHRLHLDIPFFFHRGAVSLRRTRASPAGAENAFRLLPNATMLAGIPITTGYSSLVADNRAMTDLFFWERGAGYMFRTLESHATLHPGLADIFAIRYVLRHRGWDYAYRRTDVSDPDHCAGWFDAHARLLAEQDGFRLYRVDGTQPRFHVPERVVRTQDTLGAFSAGGCREETRPRLGALDADGPRRETRQSGRVTQVEIARGEEVRLRVEAETPAHVFLGVRRHPWWEARVDGRPAPLLRANAVFMAVEVPAGTHLVELRCRARSLLAGLWVSGLSLVAFAAFFATRGLTRLRPR